MIIKETKFVKPEVSAHSLVGILTKEFPYSFGNYWELCNPNNLDKYNTVGDYYVVNIWFENFEEIVKRLDLKEVEIEVYQECGINVPSRPFCFITDKRIPKMWWIQNGPCTTGRMICSEVMHKFIEDKFSELYNN